ncbi:dephospho-CoA kinase [Calorimonas adulescens]|uniref:Dephospho-CoA kinase n=1 Tax=Calorimonas adulescens TaxID=2606906 RepID=A0A5D8QFM2_9THEO|nr:dephospho-CoA kinase [Calorimonas adulescens]TZE82333.1 dephospho-CoA kinase [Calorimonas adulescens]
MKVIGLTGGIASGKSTVSNILREMGAYVIDADEISREIIKKGSEAWKEIIDYYGNDILLPDGEIDRKKLGNIVFADKEKLDKLNAITHPRIIQRIKEIIDAEKEKGKERAVILDAAILIEMGLQNMVDEVWVVSIDKDKQIKRLIERDKLSYEDAMNRIRMQMPLSEKVKYADYVIDNSKDIGYIRKQISKLWERVIKKNN